MTPLELRDAVLAALAPVVDDLAAGEAAASGNAVGEAAAEGGADGGGPAAAGALVAARGGGRLDVRGSSHVRAAAGCAAAFAMDGETPFEVSPRVAAWQVGATMTDRILHGHRDPGRGTAATDPQRAFSVAWSERHRLDDDWAWRWVVDEAGKGQRAVTVAEATTRVAGLARLLPEWPVRAGLVGWRPSWSHPSRKVRLAGRVDVVLGRRDGTHTLVVALGGDHGPSTRPRLAYEALVETLVLRRPPATVLALLPDAGRRWAVAVDDALLLEGVAVAASAAQVALAARRADATGLTRRPSTQCRRCPYATGCEAGTTWLAGPGRLSSGFVPSASVGST